MSTTITETDGRAEAEALADAHLHAWNTRDGATVAALFAPGGTDEDPTLPGPLAGDDIAA